MKALLFLLAGIMISVGAFAQSSENAEYTESAIAAAKAINMLNWGSTPEEKFEVIQTDYTNQEFNSFGTYTVRLYLIDKKTKEKIDGGKDFEVYIYGGAVLSVKVNCRLCG